MTLTKWGLALALLSTGLVAACATTTDEGDASSSQLGRSATCPAELQRCGHSFTFPDHGESSVELRGDFGGTATWSSGVAMTKQGGVWRAEVPVPYNQAVTYKFVLNGSQWTHDPLQPFTTEAGGNVNNVLAATTCEAPTCDDEVVPPGVFDWRDSVLYFVFVDRFFNGNPSLDGACHVQGVSGSGVDYQGGDWAGVTKKIEEGYFNELGVNTLWITVPFENPSSAGKGVGGDAHLYSGYHGYWPKIDTTDPNHLSHESCFGSFDDLKTLVARAHAKGLKVLFDYAMVHVHASSALFAAHPDWFWPNSKNGSPDCICGGQYCSWEADAERCWFTDYLPHWNYKNADARAWSVTNAVAWIKQTGVDGFRADAIKHIDQSWLSDLRTKIAQEITPLASPQQRFYMVGETYDFWNRDLLKSYVDSKTKLDGQFDFPLRRNLVEATLMRTMNMSDLAAFMDSNDFYYGRDAVMSTFIGNHDLPRIIHMAANQRLWGDQYADGKDRAWQNQPNAVSELEAYERVANGFAVLFTNRGAPLVYYGDEIGLPGAGDPDNRRSMQWTGLSANQQFLRERMKKLGAIRQAHPALRRGVRTTLEATADTWLYARKSSDDTVYVAINRSDAPRSVSGLPPAALRELITGEDVQGTSIVVPPRQTRIFVAR